MSIPPTRSVAELPNLGRVMADRLAAVGISTEEQLRQAGPLAAFTNLRKLYGRSVTLNALYAMEGALSGADWRDIPSERKQELRRAAAMEISTPDRI